MSRLLAWASQKAECTEEGCTMNSMNSITYFEIQAESPERGMKFYQEVFGWSFQQWGEQKYWRILATERGAKELGIQGGLLPRPCPAPAIGQGTNAYVCTVEVANFDETAQKIEAAGGRVAMPKFAIPGIAWQGYFLDTEGNTFGVHQTDENAK